MDIFFSGHRGGGPRTARSLVAIIVAVMLGGCSANAGSSGNSGVTTGIPPVPQDPAASHAAQDASVAFTMHWPSSTSQTQSALTSRTPQYVPLTARSVSVTVNGGTPQYLNAPASTLAIDALRRHGYVRFRDV